MSGLDDVTVVWIAPDGERSAGAGSDAGAGSGPGANREDAARALAAWARAHGLSLSPAREAAPSAYGGYEPELVSEIEKELLRAREAVAALDGDAADGALARAETALREHPELPQAAWLRAEVHRGWATRWLRVEPRDEARARAAWQDADALDGGRSAGVGEVDAPPRQPVPARFVVRGARSASVVALLDGAPLAPSSPGAFTATVAPAEHHLVVSRDGEIAYAAWVTIDDRASGGDGELAPAITIELTGDGRACDIRALSRARIARIADAGRIVADGIACDRWVAATLGPRPGSVRVARCAGSACGPLVEWRTGGEALGARPTDPKKTGWPAWATWTAVGVGAAGAAVLTVLATGALASTPTTQRFVVGGVRNE